MNQTPREPDPREQSYTAFQEQLRADIANVRELASWARLAASYVPNTGSVTGRCDRAVKFCDALGTILLMQVATPEEREKYLQNEPVIETGRRFSSALKGARNRRESK